MIQIESIHDQWLQCTLYKGIQYLINYGAIFWGKNKTFIIQIVTMETFHWQRLVKFIS